MVSGGGGRRGGLPNSGGYGFGDDGGGECGGGGGILFPNPCVLKRKRPIMYKCVYGYVRVFMYIACVCAYSVSAVG